MDCFGVAAELATVLAGLPRLTPEEVEAGRSPAGGFTRKQLAAWGVLWPPPAGWLQGPVARRGRQRCQLTPRPSPSPSAPTVGASRAACGNWPNYHEVRPGKPLSGLVAGQGSVDHKGENAGQCESDQRPGPSQRPARGRPGFGGQLPPPRLTRQGQVEYRVVIWPPRRHEPVQLTQRFIRVRRRPHGIALAPQGPRGERPHDAGQRASQEFSSQIFLIWSRVTRIC
jgi:hypothetical protein